MGRGEEIAAALCRAQQVNLLLSERGAFPRAVLIFVVLLDVGVKARGARIPGTHLAGSSPALTRVAALHCNPVIMSIKGMER